MGFLDAIKKSLRGTAEPSSRGSYTPRIATTTSRFIKDNKIQTMDSAPYLYDSAEDALSFARKSLKDDRDRGHSFAERLSGAGNFLGYWHLAYSAGYPLQTLAAFIDEYLDQLSYYDGVFTKIWTSVTHNRIVDVGSRYPEPLFALAWLVGLGASRAQIERFLPFCGEPGQDALFDRLVQLAGFNRPVANTLQYPNDYRDTLAVLDAPQAQRSALIKKLLPKWFRTRFPDMTMKKPTDAEYTGHWALDIALIVMLCGVDDSSFRDAEIYPRDLVDHYRSLKGAAT